MRLVWQWVTLERELPPDWSDVQLVLKVREQDAAQAAALLGGANPLRGKDSIRLFVTRKGGGVGPEALKRTLLRLDRKDIAGTLELAGVTEAEPAPEEVRRTLDAAMGRSRRDPAAGLVGHARRDRPALERPPRVRRASRGAGEPDSPRARGSRCSSASPAASATACRPGWRGAASSGSTRKKSAPS